MKPRATIVKDALMPRRTVVIALLAAAACAVAGVEAGAATSGSKPVLPLLFNLPKPAPPPALVFNYRGWKVDASAAAHAQKPERTVRFTKAQLDLVAGVGLAPQVLADLRAAPIVVTPGLGPDAAIFRPPGVVEVHARQLDARKPTLLRALLCAEYGRLDRGQAADVARFRQAILARRAWPKSAEMLQDDRDFFADTATAYLYGAITREPYNRANLKKTQSDYYDWLARLFDGGRARR
jgi:hypothetical protein